MRRHRNAKICATLGPASSSFEMIKKLMETGADVFRLNFSHGNHQDHNERIQIIRKLELHFKRPITIVMDLQGPKLRVGTFAEGKTTLRQGQTFCFDLNPEAGNNQRVCLPHPEIFKALKPDTDLLVDDGKLRLRVSECTSQQAKTIVINGGDLLSRKGVNVPGVALPISALTEKDRQDLDFGLNIGVDWVALSFVQKPEDILEARQLVQDKAKIVAKIEKPQAIEHLDEIIALSDGIMVARGDLGVEMLPEEIPGLQKRIIQKCRMAGKPVVVATQMLESMINTPYPTRAEASDVATAIYDGVDTVMLSAESASGNYPVEAVTMMDRIITQVEKDPLYRQMIDDSRPSALHTISDAITAAAREVAHTINVPAIIALSETGATVLRAARERPESPILGLTPNLNTARYLGLVWGVYAVETEQIFSITQMVDLACHIANEQQFAKPQQHIVIIAGIPFGSSGGTNMLRVAQITNDH